MIVRNDAVVGHSDLPPPKHIDTFVDLCRWRAEQTGERPAFTHLQSTNDDQSSVSYAALDRRIRAVADALGEHGGRGERVLIVQQPGLDYVTSLFACMYAGMVAVPVYPPDLLRLRHTLPRLQAITAEADAKIMLSSRKILGKSVGPLWSLCKNACLAIDTIDVSRADHFRSRPVKPTDVALLQYTSGSTGSPRGVTLRHEHLIANVRQGYAAFDVPHAVAVVWLPPYHDMGLIGGIMLPLYGGRHSVLLDPVSFVQQPIRWLEAISRFRGTSTASPNFGYELCLRKIKPEDCEGLDLSSWQVATVGAEPIRAETLRRFAERFAPYGFQSSAFTPAYGMAEATLAISAKKLSRQPVAVNFDADALQAKRPQAIPHKRSHGEGEQRRTVELVGCGQPVDDCEVRIVDPDRRVECSDGRVGEIWVRSPAVADHYWQQPNLSEQTFNVRLQGRDRNLEAKYLRTGDLGFFHDGELFVSGRIKELIIIAGRNFFPHDIEAAIQNAHPACRVDGGTAFTVDDGSDERLIIVQEVLRPKRYDAEELVECIRQTVSTEFGISPAVVVLATAGSLPKTSSGKLRRLKCRQQYLAGDLQVRHRWAACATPGIGQVAYGNNVAAKAAVSTKESDPFTDRMAEPAETVMEHKLAPLWCEVLDLSAASREQHFLDCGGHSLAATQLLSRIREDFGIDVDHRTLVTAPRFGELAIALERLTEKPSKPTHLRLARLARDTHRMPLTAAQRRFWALECLDRHDAFLHVDLMIQIEGEFDSERLIAVLERLPQHHDALRLCFDSDEAGNPFQSLLDPPQDSDITLPVERVDLSSIDAPSQREAIRAAQRRLARQRFVIDAPPLARAALLKTGPTSHRLIFVAHHMICDGSSLRLLVNDLAQRFADDFDNEGAASLPRATGRWLDAVHWDQLALDDSVKNSRLRYWSKRLRDLPSDTQLTVYRPASSAHVPDDQNHADRSTACTCATCVDGDPASTLAGSCDNNSLADGSTASLTVQRELDLGLQTLLEQRARQWNVTPFTIWLTAWRTVLPRYCSAEDLVIGVPVANRTHTKLERLMGCFIDLVPFRTTASGDAPHDFQELVQRISHAWLQDLTHGGVSFDEILDQLDVSRDADRLPLIQHLLLHQPHQHLRPCFGQATCVDYESSYATLGAYDTALAIEAHADRTRVLLAFNHDRLDPAIAENTLDSLLETLRDGLQRPNVHDRTLPLLALTERTRIRERSRGREGTSPARTVLERFEHLAEETPDQPAVIDRDGQVSFAELANRASRLAGELASEGIGSGDLVALHLNRSRHILEAILAIWKVGAAYVPLDPNYPAVRLLEILQDAQPAFLLDDAAQPAPCSWTSLLPIRSVETLGQACEAEDAEQLAGASPDALAYVLYTSGSTGRPKGVMIEHHSVANLLESFARCPGFRPGERLLASTTISFDISVLELFLPLFVGGTATLAPQPIAESPESLLAWLDQHPADVVQGTPSSLQMLLASGWSPRAGIRIWCGGEPLHRDLAQLLTGWGAELWNVYGPTETTVWSLVHRVDPLPQRDAATAGAPGLLKTEPIGAPIDATQIAIIDSRGRLVPEGVPGELWIGGEGVGRGYLNREVLTDECFTDTQAYGRVYRTGDIVRRHADGSLEFLGRRDRQVKLRGHRVELGEVEEMLRRYPQVAQAAVTTVGTSTSDRCLVGFYTSADEASLSSDELLKFAADRLPRHLVPSSLVRLQSLPISPTGKIDYQQLPIDQYPSGKPARDDRSQKPLAEATTATERKLVEIWQDVLGLDSVGINERFFEIGGHSLKAAQMVARIRAVMRTSVSLREVYQRPTIADLAKLVEERTARPETEPVPHERLLITFAKRRRAGQLSQTSVDIALSPAEQRLWFVDQLEPNHPFYNLPLAAKIDGPLKLHRLAESLNDCVARHDPLRSSYQMRDGQPKRHVAQQLRIEPTVIDLSAAPDREEMLRELLQQESRRPFELEHGPLLRALFVRLDQEQHVVLLVMHHIVSDGWSMGVMMQEMAEFYRARQTGGTPNLQPLEVTFGEFAAWQRERLDEATVAPMLEYWQTKLSDATETLDLPTDFARPPMQDFEGATLPVVLPQDLSAAVDCLAARLSVTPFAVLMAAYSLFLSRYARQKDLTVGTAVANRPAPAMEPLIGFFVNTIVLRHQIDEQQAFGDWVRDVHDTAVDALTHQDLPFEQLVSHLASDRDRSHSPLFQAALILQNAPRDFESDPERTIKQVHVDNATAKYDLTLVLTSQEEQYVGHFEYRSSLFRPESIEAFYDSFVTLLREGTADPKRLLDDLSMLSPSQRGRIDDHSRGPIHETQPQRLDWMVNGFLEQHADRPAIAHHGHVLSYRELGDRTTKIASGLQKQGVRSGDTVIIYMGRSIDQVASLLAAIRLGCVFVPLDRQTPIARVNGIVRDVEAKVMITHEGFPGKDSTTINNLSVRTPSQLAEAGGEVLAEPEIDPADPAYLIFTSGSTGAPKGVMISHASFCHFVRAWLSIIPLDEQDRCPYIFSPSFDGALGEVFTAFAAGACLEVMDQEIVVDPARYAAEARDRSLTFATLTPPMLGALKPEDLPGVRRVLSVGAALVPELVRRWLSTHEVFNGYGPTECAVGVAIHRVQNAEHEHPPVGRPLPNARLYVLDENQQPVPEMVPGEIYIGGASVGLGYWKNASETSQRFLPDPFRESAGAKMYRTGDLGRWNRDGLLEVVGRVDDQIKLRGFRVEPSEIAAVLDRMPEVRQSVVVPQGNDPEASGSGQRLIAYFVPASASESNSDSEMEPANSVAAEDASLEKQHIDQWVTLFDESHQQTGPGLAPEDNFSGWTSVITGKPIPIREMRAWADQTAERIVRSEPDNVLEIGCGTGLIFLRIADKVRRYVGLDVMPSAIAEFQKTLQRRPEVTTDITLLQRQADQLDDLPPGTFDCIVLNSVVQYFPSREYLVRVLQKAERLLAEGGRIFLGDLRNLRLQSAFATAAELERAEDESLTVDQLNRRIHSRIEHEEELLVDPDLLTYLTVHLERLKSVETELKTTPYDNELNRFRFDATLYFDHPSGDESMEQGKESTMAMVADESLTPAWTNHPLDRRRELQLTRRIRQRLKESLPSFMIPAALVQLDELPLTLQGKVDKAALPPPPATRPEWAGQWHAPTNEKEILLTEVWEELLEISPIGIEDDFFDLGGHSMLAVRMVAEVERRSGVSLPLSSLFQRPTIKHLATILSDPEAAKAAGALVPLNATEDGVPIFCIHPAGGTVFCYRELAEHFRGQHPLIGVQARGVDGRAKPHQTLVEMAASYADAIRTAFPAGPFHLLGWSLGGNIAYEVARQLQESGGKVGMVALLDSGRLADSDPVSEENFLPLLAALFPGAKHRSLEELRDQTPQAQLEYFLGQAVQAGIVPIDQELMGMQIFEVFQANVKAVHAHKPLPFDGPITLIRPQDQQRTGVLFDDPTLGWRNLVSEVNLWQVPGDHAHMLQTPAVEKIAEWLGETVGKTK